MDTDERLDRIESDITSLRTDLHDFRTDMLENLGEIKASLASLQATIPHLATKAEVEKGKYGLIVGGIAFVASLVSLALRFI